ncbi:uncharacterized protein LOC21405733 isoform X1 [Morus notabilis]|uniref:uncharacterized protein LOC21405733 isoform X1 n=1 Tax=Morus notabilis TaxID=981085 RepID=UPI000CED5DA2|nr:uncharacterized protein LOC21405733 isoform X1 [Morus notabilis]
MRTSSASSYSFLFLPTFYYPPSRLRRHSIPFSVSSKSFHSNPGLSRSGLRLFASIAETKAIELSWVDPNSDDGYGGWAVSDTPVHLKKQGIGLRMFVIWGFGASFAGVFAAIAYLSLRRKGLDFKITSPLHGILTANDTKGSENRTTDYDKSDGDSLDMETGLQLEPDVVSENVASTFTEKVERVIIPVAVDSTQRKALSVLKNLKIIEDDVKADELCTRREYARWLVRMNSLLERNPRHRIIPSVLLSGSVKAAFNDVSVEDPDFGSIQALAEAGVVSSKLAHNSANNGFKGEGDARFSPDRFISRQDLIDWRTQLEYQILPGLIEQIFTIKLGFMDMKELTPDGSPGLYMDMLAGDNSIIRKVFGKSKRFQPNKPSTKAQAAVALTSGRMTEAIQNELLRLEAESSARQAEMEVIWSELLERGDIKRLWDEKMNEEKIHGLEVQKVYLDAVSDLEQERVVQEKHYAENLKEKAAMDCQRQLLLSLKEEVNEMSEKLASERALYVAEQCDLRDMLSDLESKQEGMLDTKSILEAEKEALRILRSWVEDEARKSHARAKVLEEVGRRWKWENQP